MRKLLIICLILQSHMALATSCRDAVVIAYESLGGSISPDAFSTSEFVDLNISIDEFNALASTEQEKIYLQIKPMELMVEETIGIINGQIDQVVGTLYEFFMVDQLQSWRATRDTLRSCQY